MISRRLFLVLTGATFVVPPAWTREQFPLSLDHIILGCKDLDGGIAFVEEHTGVRAVVGGVHPGRGTANALLSLGERHYLEIMAPDPKANTVQPSAVHQVTVLKGITTPRLINWAAHPGDIDSGIAILGHAGLSYASRRARPQFSRRPSALSQEQRSYPVRGVASWSLPI